MGLYRKYVLPRLIDQVCGDQVNTRCRVGMIPKASGRVVEIGMGSGLNLPHYSSDVTRVWGIEPSAELLAMARPKTADLAFPVEFIQSGAESIPLPDDVADTAVLTWVLCSIPQPQQVLAEVRRVLKPGGRVLFVEHGIAPDRGVQRIQNGFNPIWKHLAGGCNLNRCAETTLQDAGFTIQELDKSYLPGPRFLNYIYKGVAT